MYFVCLRSNMLATNTWLYSIGRFMNFKQRNHPAWNSLVILYVTTFIWIKPDWLQFFVFTTYIQYKIHIHNIECILLCVTRCYCSKILNDDCTHNPFNIMFFFFLCFFKRMYWVYHKGLGKQHSVKTNEK